MRRHLLGLVSALVIVGSLPALGAHAQPDYTLFESDPVRPIALSPDGTRLFVVNTPDGYLEIYDLTTGFAVAEAAVPVGLEPVAVAARNNSEVWVVNHLSDSVSVVNVAANPPRVVRTLLVGDEPRDIVFAGPGGNRAFIATAHRGQNSPYPDGDFDVPGIGRADVWVFDGSGACSVTTTTECSVDADCPGGETCTRGFGISLAGAEEHIVTLFGDRPRALAATPDGSKVYAAVYRSGNQTVAVGEGLVCNGSSSCNVLGTTYPAGRPAPKVGYCSNDLSAGCINDGDCPGGNCVTRETGLIVGFNGLSWEDEMGNDWSPAVPFSIPDLDVFEIDANASVPTELGSVAGVGTILFNMIVNPANGDVYVTNTDANNRVRFEGLGDYVGVFGSKPSGDPPSVRGNLHKSRITVLDASGDNLGTPATEFSVLPRHLNKHIPYGVIPVPAGVKEKSLATPLGMAISNDGSTLYVVGFGSDAVAVYDTTQLKNDTFVPDSANLIPVGEQPSGLALDDLNNRLYVAMRRRVDVVDTTTNTILESKYFFNPEDFSVRGGRKFLYSALLTSSNGEASCSTCHVFGDMDDLAWDLGDPDALAFPNPNPSPPAVNFPPINNLLPFDPLKGPMTTQSLRGMATSGPMHWRGDRTGGATGGDPLDENAAFNSFNVAFPGLIGRDEGELDPADMQAFTDFVLQLTYPPNPVRALNNLLTTAEQDGLDLYTGRITDAVANCEGCHELDRAQGFFGTGGGSTFEAETMEFKVPHLRNAYQKVGMFGQMPSPFFPEASGVDMGDQVRATGFLHDGSVATAFDFFSAAAFSLDLEDPRPETERRALEALMMAFETDMAPIVGQQVTLTDTSGPDVDARITLLMQRAEADFVMPGDIQTKECDLIVKGVVNGKQRGWVYQGGDAFKSDAPTEALWSRGDLESAASLGGQALTFTCVPPGSGTRMGIDRDRDKLLDGGDSAPTIPYVPGTGSDCGIAPAPPAATACNALFLLVLGILTRRVVTGRRRRRRLAALRRPQESTPCARCELPHIPGHTLVHVSVPSCSNGSEKC